MKDRAGPDRAQTNIFSPQLALSGFILLSSRLSEIFNTGLDEASENPSEVWTMQKSVKYGPTQ